MPRPKTPPIERSSEAGALLAAEDVEMSDLFHPDSQPAIESRTAANAFRKPQPIVSSAEAYLSKRKSYGNGPLHLTMPAPTPSNHNALPDTQPLNNDVNLSMTEEDIMKLLVLEPSQQSQMLSQHQSQLRIFDPPSGNSMINKPANADKLASLAEKEIVEVTSQHLDEPYNSADSAPAAENVSTPILEPNSMPNVSKVAPSASNSKVASTELPKSVNGSPGPSKEQRIKSRRIVETDSEEDVNMNDAMSDRDDGADAFGNDEGDVVLPVEKNTPVLPRGAAPVDNSKAVKSAGDEVASKENLDASAETENRDPLLETPNQSGSDEETPKKNDELTKKGKTPAKVLTKKRKTKSVATAPKSVKKSKLQQVLIPAVDTPKVINKVLSADIAESSIIRSARPKPKFIKGAADSSTEPDNSNDEDYGGAPKSKVKGAKSVGSISSVQKGVKVMVSSPASSPMSVKYASPKSSHVFQNAGADISFLRSGARVWAKRDNSYYSATINAQVHNTSSFTLSFDDGLYT
jgi:hypothetical protein